jgi:hypothetical protein
MTMEQQVALQQKTTEDLLLILAVGKPLYCWNIIQSYLNREGSYGSIIIDN